MLIWLLPRRLRSTWVLLAITSFGILTSITLMAVGAIYSKALAEGGLRHTLALTSPVILDAQVVVQNRPLGLADYQKLRATVEENVDAYLGRILIAKNTQRFGNALSLPMVRDPEVQRIPQGGARAAPFFLTDFEKHTRIVEGRWPQSTPRIRANGVDLEVVAGKQTASAMSWEVGTQVYMLPLGSNLSENVAFTLVGLVEPIDPSEEYWLTSVSYYFNAGGDDPWTIVPMYVPEDDFFTGLGAEYPFLLGDYWWLLFVDTGQITADTAGPTKEAVAELEKQLNSLFPRSVVFSVLDETIADYQRELNLARVPLFLFISLVVVVVLYFLVLVLGLLAHTQSDSASILRSRGASMIQVSGLFALGEGIVVLLSLALGPLLALGIARYFLVSTINPAGDGGTLPVALSVDAFLVGAIGGLLSLAVLTLSGVTLARQGMVEFLRIRARPPSIPLLHRYYVDFLVIAVVALIWWQIEERGGFLERNLEGGALKGVDLSLLLGPVLVLLAAGFLVPRIFPLLFKALAWTARLAAPAWMSLTLTRMSRDPLQHGSLIIVLMLVTALGVFGAGFKSTLSKSQQDQARYSIGSDLVIKGPSFSASVQDAVASIPGIRSVSPILRDTGAIVGIDPDTFSDVAWFRSDFAGKDLPDLLSPLRHDSAESPGITIPKDAERMGLWVRVDSLPQALRFRTLYLWARLSDSSGNYQNLQLGKLPSQPLAEEWTFFEASLPQGQAVTPLSLSLVSVYISGGYGTSLNDSQPGTISIDDITAISPSNAPNGITVEDFEATSSRNNWVAIPSVNSTTDHVEHTRQAARSGGFGLTFTWRNALSGAPRGILIPPGPLPLPAIGGPSLNVGQRLQIESESQAVPLVVVDTTSYFPTIQTSVPFLLVNMEDYRQYIQRMPSSRSSSTSRELWVSLNGAVSRSRVISSIKERVPGVVSVEDQASAVELAQHNPLAGGGWNGLTLLSVSVLTIVVAVTLVTYSVVSVQGRSVDLAIGEALGFSRAETLLSLVLERLVVAIIGIAVGSAVGIWLSRWVLGFLDVTTSGTTVVPPMLITIHSGIMTLVYADLAAAVVAGTVVAALSALRLKASDILRAGQ